MALQALLLPLSVAIGSAPAGALCVSGGSAGHMAIGHESGCPCAAGCGMQCGMHAAGAPPQTLLTLASFDAVRLQPPPAVEQAGRPMAHSPQLARAPPAA